MDACYTTPVMQNLGKAAEQEFKCQMEFKTAGISAVFNVKSNLETKSSIARRLYIKHLDYLDV